MSAGHGKLQKSILDKLNSSASNKLIFQHALLWDIAVHSGEIEKDVKSPNKFIEFGKINKSFKVNFERALKSLEGSGIIRQKIKITDLGTIFDLLPTLTSRLEIHQLRIILLPAIKEYIESPSMTYKKIDPLLYQIDILKKENEDLFNEFISNWIEIENQIIKLFPNVEQSRFDKWLNILLSGRQLFRGRKDANAISLIPFSKNIANLTVTEHKIINCLENLMIRIQANSEWKIGNAKKILYALFSASIYGKTSLTPELKHHLWIKHKDLIISLPGHREPTRVQGLLRNDGIEISKMHITFSPLLDQLFNRHIFREQFVIELIR